MKAFFFMWILLHVLSPLRLVGQSSDRLTALGAQLDSLSTQIPALLENSRVSLQQVPLSEYVRALGKSHQLNLFIADTPSLLVSADWPSASVRDILFFLCKEYHYRVERSGNIIALHPYIPLVEKKRQPKEPDIQLSGGLLRFNLQHDSLQRVLPILSRLTGKRILMPVEMQGVLSGYLPPTPVDTALEAIFLANGLVLQSHRKGYFLVQPLYPPNPSDPPPPPRGRLDFALEALFDGQTHYLSLSATDADLFALVKAVFAECGRGYLLYESLQGRVSIEAEMLPLEDLLQYLFQGTAYTFRQEESLYLLGDKDLPGLRTTRLVHLQYRPTFQALELIPGIEAVQTADPGRPMVANPEARPYSASPRPYDEYGQGNFGSAAAPNPTEVAPPPEIRKSRLGEVDLVEYPELNRIILKGPADEVAEIETFLHLIDQPVPMVKVEMLVLEVNQDRLLQTDVEAGLKGESDSTTLLTRLLPQFQTELTGSQVNQLLGQIPALGQLGRLDQNFYLQLKAEEARGNLKVTMQPVLSMLNGRSASLVIGQTQYFLLETQTAASGAVNNFSQFSQRFERIEANIQLSIRPYISADSTVTLEVLPNFTNPVGVFDAQVPPTIATRRFDSTIRVKDGETVILGGLTEERKSEATQGLPLLSRIPVLKYLFGSTEKGKTRNSLLIYLTPTIYYQ